MSEKLPPHEAWDRAVESHIDDEVLRAEKRSPEDLDRSLEAKGLDPKGVRAKGEALMAKIKAQAEARAKAGAPAESSSPPPASEPPSRTAPVVVPQKPEPKKSGWAKVVWLAPAALAAALILLVMRQPGQPTGELAQHVDAGPRVVPSVPPWQPREQLAAVTLRTEAYAACDKRQWEDCEEKLNAAWRLDPDGDRDPVVQRAHKVAQAGITEQEARDNAKR
jgi:hypothetical protein